MTVQQRKAELYRAANVQAARIIATDPERYPGIMQEWAAKVLRTAGEVAVGTPTKRRAA